jgi:hypothetical protein
MVRRGLQDHKEEAGFDFEGIEFGFVKIRADHLHDTRAYST